jgi:hypothetical protein
MTPAFSSRDFSMQTYAEQISAFEARRASAVAGMEAIMSKAAEDGRTLDASEKEEYDTLEKDVDEIDEHVERLRRAEKSVAARATPINGAKSPDDGARLRSSFGSVQLKSRPEKGIAFVRLLGAKYLAMQHHCAPWDIAKRWKDTPEVEMVLRAAVAPGSTTDTTFADSLVELNNMTGEFIDLSDHRPRPHPLQREGAARNH